MPLGPGQPPAFLRALGEREDWTDLRVYGALLAVGTELFSRPGVHYLSGFYGPLERALRDSGADIEFTPADFRRFGPLLRGPVPAGDDDGRHAARRGRLVLACRCTRAARSTSCTARAPTRTGCSSSRSRTPTRGRSGSATEHRHALHVDEIDVLVRLDGRAARAARRRGTAHRSRQGDRPARRRLHPVRRDAADRHRRRSLDRSPTLLAEGDGGDYGMHSEMFTDGCMRLHGRARSRTRQGPVRRRQRRRRSRSARRSSTTGWTATTTSRSCRSRSSTHRR